MKKLKHRKSVSSVPLGSSEKNPSEFYADLKLLTAIEHLRTVHQLLLSARNFENLNAPGGSLWSRCGMQALACLHSLKMATVSLTSGGPGTPDILRQRLILAFQEYELYREQPPAKNSTLSTPRPAKRARTGGRSKALSHSDIDKFLKTPVNLTKRWLEAERTRPKKDNEHHRP